MTLDELTAMMAGGAELEALSHELSRDLGADSAIAQQMVADVAEIESAMDTPAEPEGRTRG